LNKILSDFKITGVLDNPYKLSFSKTDPFDKAFIRIAEEVFAPLLKHCRKI